MSTSREITYRVSKRGLATAFSEDEMPLDYCTALRNRFISIAGKAEKRPGMTQLGATIPGTPTIDALHELVKKDGTTITFASGMGVLYSLSSGSWVQVFAFEDQARMKSVQFDSKLIFFNGVNRSVYTEDGVEFKELLALLEQGVANSSTSAAGLGDSDVLNWIGGTDVAINDLVHYPDLNAYAVVTQVNSASIVHTGIGAANSGLGLASRSPQANDGYQIADLVELNIVEAGPDLDNVGTAISGTSANGVNVSGVPDFNLTEVRVGDILYNTTRGAIAEVSAISTANLSHTAIGGQTVGDSIIFLKSAQPIPSAATVHFGRLYQVDSRDKRKIRISGANDPQDMTSDAGTLDSISFNAGALQPVGETIKALSSFQQFFTFGGERNVFAYTGTTPIGAGADFAPIGLFPQGVRSDQGMVSLGNDMTFVTHDGLQAFSVVDDSSNLRRANISEAIRPTLRTELDAVAESEIVAIHYPQRSWLLLKVGSKVYCYNYSVFVGDGNKNAFGGSWAEFDGLFARQKAFLVRKDGSLICAGAGGKVYEFDTGVYTDAGERYQTRYATSRITLEEPKSTVRQKQVKYIKPLIDAPNAFYTIDIEGGFDVESRDSISVATSGAGGVIGSLLIGSFIIGGSSILNQKHPLRANGEVFKVTFSTDDENGPDALSKFTLYANTMGRR